MKHTDPRIDAYITASVPFAQPVLNHLRSLIHLACPEVHENIKWGMPAFEYKGPLCGMAAFKAHCTFAFWKSSLISDPDGVLQLSAKSAMGHFGKITGLRSLPADQTVMALIKDAVRLNEEGIKVVKKKRAPKDELPAPSDMLAIIQSDALAEAVFTAFAPAHRREYIAWIAEAKTEATRSKRIAQMMEQLQEGKSRHWKYK